MGLPTLAFTPSKSSDSIFHMRFEGAEELERHLKRIGADAEKVLLRALRKGAKPILRSAIARAPVQTSGWSGATKAGRHAPGTLKKALRIVKRKPRFKGEIEIGIGCGNDAFYARLVEMGHHLVGRNPLTGQVVHGEVPAHPFLRPAFDANWRTARDDARDSLATSMKRYERKQARLRAV